MVSTFPFLWLAFWASYIVILLPVFGYRLIVQKLARYYHPDWDTMMSDKDTIVGADHVLSDPLCVLPFYNVICGDVDLEEFRSKFYNDLILFKDPVSGTYPNKKLQQYTESWLGYYFCKWDKNFKIENHIKILPGTENNRFTTEDEFLELVGPLMTKPFEAKRSYWECLIVKNYIPKYCENGGSLQSPRTMILYRMHVS